MWLKSLFRRRQKSDENCVTVEIAPQQTAAPAPPPRITRRMTDIGTDVLSRTYTPPQSSAKASFRSDGADHHSDQEFATGADDENRWNDEDRFTNKSNDPRIGTHGRTYEPAESRDTREQ